MSSGMASDWPAWHFVCQSWIVMLSQKMHTEMKEAAENLQPVTVVIGARETEARSTQLFHILVLVVKGRALEMLRSFGNESSAESAPSPRSLETCRHGRRISDWGARRGKVRQCSWLKTVCVCVCHHSSLWSTARKQK